MISLANILIVEDEKAMQDIIAEYMQKGGHTCFTASDGIDALVMLKSRPMDLMILDVMMPHMDGFSVCKMARETSNMPIIMLTTKSGEEDKLRGYGYGADDYITVDMFIDIVQWKAMRETGDCFMTFCCTFCNFIKSKRVLSGNMFRRS